MRRLAQEGRVLVLGGLAVIAHGFSRTTKDADVWLQPFSSSEEWAEHLIRICLEFPRASIHALPDWAAVEGQNLPSVVDEIGMVRILGFECPVDVFRRPNNFGEDEFNEAFKRARPSEDGTWLPDPLDLILSKEDTGRDRGRSDISFLQDKVRRDFGAQLEFCSVSEAKELFGRYTDYAVASAALRNPDPAVQALALDLIRELAAGGDPFARDMLQEREGAQRGNPSL